MPGAQWRRVEQVLRAGAQASGFDGELWTLARIATVIQETTGVAYHPNYIAELLHRRGWSPQRPARRALERDDGMIAGWVGQTWPTITRGSQAGQWIVVLDESSRRLNPPIRRTWAPRGQTPVLRERRRNLPTLSMAALACDHPGDPATGLEPDARVLDDFHPGSYDTSVLISVLERLHRFLDGAPVTLIFRQPVRARQRGQAGLDCRAALAGDRPAAGLRTDLKGGRGAVVDPQGL